MEDSSKVDFDEMYRQFNLFRDDKWYRFSERQAFEMAISKILTQPAVNVKADLRLAE